MNVTEEPPMTTALSFVRASNPLSRRLLRLGMPMGPNVLLTVRGRTSGLPRSTAVAVVEYDGRRYVIGAYGDVQWTRNLRAAGEAQIRVRGLDEPVAARQLDRAEATDFYVRVLPTYTSRLPWFGRVFGRILFGVAAPEIRDDPQRAAVTRPVFELRSIG
jgi:deazaflavin-dependent oxidoreductase (nitroreductase family)